MSDSKPTEEKASNTLFDLRTVIGGLFAVYGLVCLIWGFVSYTDTDRAKTGGINLNLWAGIGMLVVAAIFLVWAFTKPIAAEDAEEAVAEARAEENEGHTGTV